jgi:hypothetical protein
MPVPFDFSKIDIDKLPTKAQNAVLLLALTEEDYIDGDNILMYSKIPIYTIKMPENPKEEFTFEQFHKIFFYLLKSDFVFPFSFIDDSINDRGFRPIYFLLSSNLINIHKQEKAIIEQIDIDNDLAFLLN